MQASACEEGFSSDIVCHDISQSRVPMHIMLGKMLSNSSTDNRAKFKAVVDFSRLSDDAAEKLNKLSFSHPKIWKQISKNLLNAKITPGGSVKVDILLLANEGQTNDAKIKSGSQPNESVVTPVTNSWADSLESFKSGRTSNHCPGAIESGVMHRKGFPKFSRRMTTSVPVDTSDKIDENSSENEKKVM